MLWQPDRAGSIKKKDACPVFGPGRRRVEGRKGVDAGFIYHSRASVSFNSPAAPELAENGSIIPEEAGR